GVPDYADARVELLDREMADRGQSLDHPPGSVGRDLDPLDLAERPIRVGQYVPQGPLQHRMGWRDQLPEDPVVANELPTQPPTARAHQTGFRLLQLLMWEAEAPAIPESIRR